MRFSTPAPIAKIADGASGPQHHVASAPFVDEDAVTPPPLASASGPLAASPALTNGTTPAAGPADVSPASVEPVELFVAEPVPEAAAPAAEPVSPDPGPETAGER